MRPERLEMRGLASFRDATTLDFDGADLFVLAGPTGAGKSSVIDAIVFALYGSVPRYDDRRLVAPVITQGQLEARVRLTFSVEGRRYAATRVVRRTRTGATTKEARLEQLTATDDGDHAEVLAGTADELTSQVEQLLGLTFDHFTKTVVLPQGDFQEFLHAKPKDRQDLLVELLDLDVYRRVAQAARRRAEAADARVVALLDRLDTELAGATEEAVAEAARAVERLERAQRLVDEATPELARLEEAGRERRREATGAGERLSTLRTLQPPDGVAAVADRIDAADRSVTEAARALEEATAAREGAEEAAGALPDAAVVRSVLELETEAAELRRRRADAVGGHERAVTARQAATDRLEEATRALEEATAAVRDVERRHLAHALAVDLEVGGECPVCRTTVTELPPVSADEDVERARAAQAAADAARREAEAALRATERTATQAESSLEGLTTQLERLDTRLASARAELPEPQVATAEIERLGVRLEEVSREAAAAVRAERDARLALEAARRERTELDRTVEAAWEEVDRARMAVASLDPPTVDRDDLAGAWSTLVAWREELEPRLVEAAEGAEAAIGEAVAAYRKRLGELRDAVAELGVEDARAELGQLDRAVSAALASASGTLERLRGDVEAATRARREVDEAKREREVARSLGQHLNARNFEQWLLNRALKRLVVGASAILRDLSDGRYSLDVAEDGAFLVVDHLSADERRPAKTLSGGETFLASLSLALALAEHVAELAAEGSARLEALFLDEGFGTLDAETLDTVAAAIEELGARGRMVGIITHVRDLAERIPVRFEVRRTASSSTVEKVVR